MENAFLCGNLKNTSYKSCGPFKDAHLHQKSRTEMLPKNLIARLLMQDLNGWGFGGLLSRTTVHAVVGMGKTSGGAAKGTGSQDMQKERSSSKSGRSPRMLGHVARLDFLQALMWYQTRLASNRTTQYWQILPLMAKVYRSAKVVLNLPKEFSNRREYNFFCFCGPCYFSACQITQVKLDQPYLPCAPCLTSVQLMYWTEEEYDTIATSLCQLPARVMMTNHKLCDKYVGQDLGHKSKGLEQSH
jgi:hypothetical protein